MEINSIKLILVVAITTTSVFHASSNERDQANQATIEAHAARLLVEHLQQKGIRPSDRLTLAEAALLEAQRRAEALQARVNPEKRR